jgi:hypothetical protein
MKLIAREINQSILPNAEKLIEENSNKSHAEICELLLEMDFVSCINFTVEWDPVVCLYYSCHH